MTSDEFIFDKFVSLMTESPAFEAEQEQHVLSALIESGMIIDLDLDDEDALDQVLAVGFVEPDLWRPGFYARAGRKAISEGGPEMELRSELSEMFTQCGLNLEITELGLRDVDQQLFTWEATVCGNDAVFEAPGVPTWISVPAHPVSHPDRRRITLPFELVAMSELLGRVFAGHSDRTWYAANHDGAFGHFLVTADQLRLLHTAEIVHSVAQPQDLGRHITSHLRMRTA